MSHYPKSIVHVIIVKSCPNKFKMLCIFWKLSKSACVQGRVTDRLSGVDAPDGPAGPAASAVTNDEDGDDDGRQKK